jgi:hypothetical protein
VARRALLIGAERYGAGFETLHAAPHDVALLKDAFTACGYFVEVCSDETVRSASALDANIRDFLRRCRADDIYIVYFSGHGVLLGDTDRIVPAGVSREQAATSSTQTVSTDFGSVLSDDAGLAIVIIDACRNPDDAPTLNEGSWGDPRHQSVPRHGHFLRLFGCRSGEVCQVLPSGPGEAPVSLFSRALASTLAEGRHTSLSAVLTDLESRCAELARSAHLATQTPRISLPREFSAHVQEQLNRVILDRAPQVVLPGIWDAFDPDRFHCLVVQSEQERKTAPVRDVIRMVKSALIGADGKSIWEAFRPTAHGRRLVSGRRRNLSEVFDQAAVRFAACNVVDVLTSADTLDRAVRAIVEADLVVFDVTAFEPGLMLLVGIRAATARGLTICSHGGTWEEGTPLNVPFNLQNLNVQSHAPSKERTGRDPVVSRFVSRVMKGYDQLRKHAHYLDLPAYDDLRQLGSDYDASSTISARERVLVLCAYKDTYFEQWRFVQSELKNALWEAHQFDPAVERIIDHGTPQLVSQALYEQLRRGAACVMDWSYFSASVFMELGIRLAVSSRGAVQLVERRCVYGEPEAPDLAQVQRLQQIFDPIVYTYPGDSDAFLRAAAAIVQHDEDAAQTSGRLHRVVIDALNVVHGSHRDVYEELRESADALHHRKQGSEGVAQILFHRSFPLKRDSERAALERRVAAWLYLDQRLNAGETGKGSPLHDVYVRLGKEVASGLLDLGEDVDVQLAKTIRNRVKAVEN